MKRKAQPLCILLFLPYISSYTWFSQFYYHTDNCEPYSNTSYSSLASILLQEMNKCFQTSQTSSSLSTCSNTSITINKNTNTYNSDGSCSNSATSDSATISSACAYGISSSCAQNPGYETWAAVGIWQQSSDGGLGASCNAYAGPQFVQVFPPYCTTDGQSSWQTTCTSTSLSYTQFNSVDCTGGVVGANSFTYSPGTCFQYTPPPTSGLSGAPDVVQMGYASCSVKTIPGTTFLDIPPSTPMGGLNSNNLSGSAMAGIVVAVVVMVMICCLVGYYLVTNYDINEKLLKDSNHDDTGRDSSSVGHRASDAAAAAAALKALGSLERGSSSSVLEIAEHEGKRRRKVYTDPATFLYDILTCACCYHEYD